MNAQTKIVGTQDEYETLREAMIAEGVFQVRCWHPLRSMSVVMTDKRTGSGRTFREAIETATHERLESA